MVERFHRQLKAALKATLAAPNWIEVLPCVLLGIRTAPKEDLGCSSAELVFGYPLTVPGDFVASEDVGTDYKTFKDGLNETVRTFIPTPPSQHGFVSSNIPSILTKSDFVFLRRDCHKAPLERPYEGPFKVLEAGDKVFTLDIGGKRQRVSVDRLKPAHINVDAPV